MFEPIAYGEYEGETYLIEPSGQRETIHVCRNSDGKCFALTGPRMVTETRLGVKKHGADKTVATHARLGKSGHAAWFPMYKPGGVARLIELELQAKALKTPSSER